MLLIRDADYILTLDARRRVLERHSLLIKDTRITDIGPAAEMDARHLTSCRRQGAVVEARGRLVLPGYVNTHVHTFEHLSRGLIPDNLSTYAWAVTYARPFYAALTEDEAYIAARLACLEMLRSGTTCFVDVNILVSLGHLDAVAQAVTESGMRAVLGRGVFDLMPKEMADAMPPALRERVLSPSAAAALREVEALLDRWTSSAGGRIRAWASIYGLFPYCSDELFSGLRGVAERYGVGMAFHIASSIEEAQAVEKRVGAWPITHLDRLGVLGPNLLLTHCTAITDREVGILAERGTKVAYCPGAALRLAKGTTRIGKIPEMLAAGVTVSLGADGVSSSGTFDPARLAGLVAGLFKDARMDPTLVPAETALEMATLNGARAVLWDDALGSVEVGKTADLALYDLEAPEWVPRHDVVRNLVYCADGRTIRTVLVNGRIVYDDGRAVGIDAGKAVAEASAAGERIAQRLGLDPRRRWPLVQ
ncbi:MAG: amidohydrolase family protein [Candidatus Rokuibacteriota bacterium]